MKSILITGLVITFGIGYHFYPDVTVKLLLFTAIVGIFTYLSSRDADNYWKEAQARRERMKDW